MRLPPELSLTACGTRPLLESVRQALAEEGRAPSRRRVHDWIAAGLVRVDGRAVRDPDFVPPPEGRLDLVPELAQGAPALDTSGDPRHTAPMPILHLDRHLLVALVESPASAAIEAPLAGCLEAAAWHGRRPDPRVVPAWLPGATGVVVAALTPEAATSVERAFEEGSASAEVLACVEAVAEAEGVHLVARGDAGRVVGLACRGPRDALARLQAAGTPPLPTVTPPHPPATGIHVLRVSLRHPRQGRGLSWEAAPPPWAS